MALLEIKNLKVSYGFIAALKGIDINVEKGQIVALLGSNGAGKTTFIKDTIRSDDFFKKGTTLILSGEETSDERILSGRRLLESKKEKYRDFII